MTTTSDDRSIKFWKFAVDNGNVSVKPYRSGFAHTARVFQAKVVEEENKPYIISVGEDSYICLWNTSGDLIFKRRQHFGATIWNFEYDATTKRLHTIGSDSNHLILNLEHFFKPSETLEIPFSNLNGYLSKIVVCNGILIGVSNQNKTYYKKGNEWIAFPDFTSFKCTVLKSHKNLVIFAGYKRICIFEFNGTFVKVLDEEIMDGVIRSVLPLDKNTLLICDEQGSCKIMSDYSTDNLKIIDLPKFKEIWITSATQLDSGLLVLSNRMGHLLLYKECEAKFVLKDELKRVHGSLGATSIQFVKRFDDNFYIRTSGHDSCLRTIKINKKESTMEIVSKEVISVSWVERVENGFHFGFNDNHFVVWSKEKDFEVEIQCGGGHRCWDYLMTDKEFSLFFIKNRKLHLKKVPFNQLIPTSNSFWHLKPCNQLEVCDEKLFSAGEENVLKIWKMFQGKIKLEHELHSHISSIKTVKVQKLNTQRVLIFSAGGRAQICVNELTETNLTEESLNFMLKNNDFERKFHRNPQEIDFDPETRFMSLDVQELSEEVFKMFIGCSDGYLRVFKYDNKNRSIEFISEVSFERCFLHVKVLSEPAVLLTSTTDGFVNLWDLNNTDRLLLKYRHHDSGANALDVLVKGDYLHICTGGDDQAIVYSKVSLKDSKVELLKRFERVHSSQVNGIRFSESGLCFYTFGVDQDVYKVDIGDFEIKKVHYSSVADSKGLNVCGKYCFVYGSGIDWFEIKEDL
ncbi:WDR6 family protein [Megaselia abdita]